MAFENRIPGYGSREGRDRWPQREVKTRQATVNGICEPEEATGRDGGERPLRRQCFDLLGVGGVCSTAVHQAGGDNPAKVETVRCQSA